MTGRNLRDGAEVQVSPLAGSADEVMADLRCHRTWVAAVHADSPFALPGVEVSANNTRDGVSLQLSTRDPALVPVLQHRIVAEAAARDAQRHDGE
ncbi:MAG: hypothetical protein ABI867_17410 [Kofleriaceae bacterium]